MKAAGRPPSIESCVKVLAAYRAASATGKVSHALTARARRAFLHLSGDPQPSNFSVGDYDHERYGPFLGVSDEGSAAADICDAALRSPKVLALLRNGPDLPLIAGLAVDAERLGGIGELIVGPDEYADIWLACVGRSLVTTNVSTRVNLRVYKREPRVLLPSDDPRAVARAKKEIAAAFRPFVQTPDGVPRPLTVFIDIPRYARLSTRRKRAALRALAAFVASGDATGRPAASAGHALGLAAWLPRGLPGRDAAFAAIDLAAAAELPVVILDGVKRKAADASLSFAGLLDYFEPGIVGPILRRARDKNVRVRAANLPDTDTVARSIWVGLSTARRMGASLGKYGCFPLTLSETDHVVSLVQSWFPFWTAAPVLFVDQGLLREDAIDVASDLPRGIERWMKSVAAHGVRVVLIDTLDKTTGCRLVKRNATDRAGFLGLRQIARLERYARQLGLRVLWAGGLALNDAYELARLGVFGIYVTSAAATSVPVAGAYARDPALPSVKEPSQEAVLRTKILIEAGFLSSRLQGPDARDVARTADRLLTALAATDATELSASTAHLASLCLRGWRLYWTRLNRAN